MKKLTFLLMLSIFGACSEKQLPIEQLGTPCTNANSLYVLAGKSGADVPCLIPQKERKALILYFMSTDCPGCGSWGTSTFHTILDENEGKTEGLQIHIKYADPWILPGFSDSMVARFNPRYTPFVMVENFVPAGAIQVNNDPAYVMPRAQKEIEEITSEPAEISPALAMEIKDGKVKIHYGGMYEEDTEDTYSFGIYLMEDGLEYNQAGSSVRPYYHKNTIREVLGGPWGTTIPGGNHMKGEYFIGELETDLVGYWNQKNLHVLGVVWKKDHYGKYQVVNTIHAR